LINVYNGGKLHGARSMGGPSVKKLSASWRTILVRRQTVGRKQIANSVELELLLF